MSSSSSMSALSPELHLAIISHLSLSNKRRLRLVSTTFSNLLSLDVPLEELQAAKKNKTIFLVKDAKRGSHGIWPFIIAGVRTIRDQDLVEAKLSTRILVDLYYPKFMRNDEEKVRTKDGWEIQIEMDRLYLDSSTKMESNRTVKDVDYESLRGKLIKASAALLRARFRCPECHDSRWVCPGCGGFSSRFSGLFGSCDLDMPCPVCIGYGVADASDSMRGNDKKLEKLWKGINEMLAAEKSRT
ncbi:hypothetical protein C8R47DRAFT_1089059 [Mycena vitilis]|nr:hypothetical protein C8R47DRAFT_1089059 [Mycena vitilis]